MNEQKPEGIKTGIASVLSRFASLMGIAVPAFRFGMVETGRSGAVIADLSLRDQVIELWLGRFAQGHVEELSAEKVSRSDFPFVWVGQDSTAGVLLVRGASSSGAWQAENADGETVDLTLETAQSGTCLGLAAQVVEVEKDKKNPKSARDWFGYVVGKQKKVFYEAVVATFVISALGLFTALYTMQVYDRVVPTKGFSTLWVLTIGVALAILFELLMKQARARITDVASKNIDLELGAVFFSKAMAIRMDGRPSTVGTFASQIRHFESVRMFMTSSTLFILADAPFALLFIGVIAIIGGPVAYVPLITVPIAIASSFFFLRKIKAITSENMVESNQKNGLLIEAIDGAESIKAAGGEWKIEDRYRELSATISHSDLKMRTLQARASTMGQSIQQANYVGMIATGAFAITEGLLTMGALIACSIIAGRALTPISQIPGLVMQWNQARIALEGLDTIMEMPSDREFGERLVVPDNCRGEIRIAASTFCFVPEQPVIEIGQLELRPGERVAVVGSVGSGKSTLIKLLSGLYKPTQGSVFLDGIDMQHLAPEFVREHVGYLPQDVRLFQGTLRDNLTLGLPTPSDSKLLEACELTGLQQLISKHPLGLELPISEGGRGLSGGQRQLVGLTRMLLAKPKILLMDEPTAAMDGPLEASVMKHLFGNMPKESTIVVVTHKVGLLAQVDRVLIMDGGTIKFDGPKDQVQAILKEKVQKESVK